MSRYNDNSSEELAGCFGATATLILVSIFRGAVLQKMWEWFVVYTFGLKPLSIVSALGLSFTLSMFVPRANTNCKKDDKEQTVWMLIAKIIGEFVGLAITLGIGYILTLCR